METTGTIQARITKPGDTVDEQPEVTSPSPLERLRELPQRIADAAAENREVINSTLTKAANVLMYAVVLLLVFMAYGSIPNRWYKVITIEGNSMAPTLRYGDVIVVKRPPRVIEEGTIVTLQVEDAIVTHRFVGYDEDGRRIFKGDANDRPDNYSQTNYHIVGVYLFRIPLLGHINIQANRALQSTREMQGANPNGP